MMCIDPATFLARRSRKGETPPPPVRIIDRARPHLHADEQTSRSLTMIDAG